MHDERGVTLLEVIVLIAIIGIFTAISIPRIGSNREQAARIAARQLVADMRYARGLAVSSGQNHIVRFYSAVSPVKAVAKPLDAIKLEPTIKPAPVPVKLSYTEYRIYRVVGSGQQQVGESRAIPEKVTCIGPNEFVFQPLGNATTNGTIVFVSDRAKHAVNVVAATGRVY